MKCITCDHCSFVDGNGSPARWYCRHHKSPSVLNHERGSTLIMKGSRHQQTSALPRKREPRWCPLKSKVQS